MGKKPAAAAKPAAKSQGLPSPPSGGGAGGALIPGDRVRVGGLNGAIELNGQVAVVFKEDKPSGRYLVEFENGAGQKMLKKDNLVPLGNSTGALAAKARMYAGV